MLTETMLAPNGIADRYGLGAASEGGAVGIKWHWWDTANVPKALTSIYSPDPKPLGDLFAVEFNRRFWALGVGYPFALGVAAFIIGFRRSRGDDRGFDVQPVSQSSRRENGA